MRGQLRLGLDARQYGPTSHLPESDIFAGYAGLRRKALNDAEFRAALTGEPIPEVLLLRGRRCPCGSHGPMSDLERRQRQMAAMTIAEESLVRQEAS